MADMELPAKQPRYNLRSAVRANRISIPLQEPKRKHPESKLMTLNDNCILAIFEHLTPNDLTNLSKVNKRLNALVKYFAQLKYKLQFRTNFDFHTNDGSLVRLKRAQAFLSIFGNDIITLTLDSGSFVEETDADTILHYIPSVQEHCNLKELTIKNFGMQSLYKSVFQELEILTLDNCSVDRSWCKMSKLKTLKLNQFIVRRWPLQYSGERSRDWKYGMSNPPVPIPVNCFGALEELRISDTNLQNDTMAKLIKLNPALKKLSVVKSVGTSTHLFKALVGLKQLEEFEFKKLGNQGHRQALPTNIHELMPLMSLKSLKTLKFTYSDYPPQQLIEGLLENGIALEHLELGAKHFDDATAVSIAKMASIKVLKLNGMIGLNQSHLVTMVNGLKLLEEMHIKMTSGISCNAMQEIVRTASRLTRFKYDGPIETLSRETYQAILASVQARAERNLLEITIYGNGNQLLIPTELFNVGDDEWFMAKELDRNSNHLFESLVSTVSLEPPPSKQRHYYSSDTDTEDDY